MEKGRSLVEMLATLAIIGVLSVVGVQGFQIAIYKHKANNILHEASIRATSIMTQRANNKSVPPNLGEFPNTIEGATVSVKGPSGNSELSEGDIQFALVLSSLDDKVFNQLKNEAGTSGIVRKIIKNTDNSIALIYNEDLSTTEDECENSCNYSYQECSNKTCQTKTGYCPTYTFVRTGDNKSCTIQYNKIGTTITCKDSNKQEIADCTCEDNKEWACFY